jgi:hypothetical protein
MADSRYSIELSKDEETIAQLLTRDAWVYFANLISTRDLFHVKEVPLTPRRGMLHITTDQEVVHYYLCFADAYVEETRELGWDSDRYATASTGLIRKLEAASGLVRGESTDRVGESGG